MWLHVSLPYTYIQYIHVIFCILRWLTNLSISSSLNIHDNVIVYHYTIHMIIYLYICYLCLLHTHVYTYIYIYMYDRLYPVDPGCLCSDPKLNWGVQTEVPKSPSGAHGRGKIMFPLRYPDIAMEHHPCIILIYRSRAALPARWYINHQPVTVFL